MATDSKRRPAKGRLPKPARLNARLTGSQKQLLEHAATLTGRSLTDFVVSTAEDAAVRTIREHEIMTLSARDSEVFAAALLGTRPAPRHGLRKLPNVTGASHHPVNDARFPVDNRTASGPS